MPVNYGYAHVDILANSATDDSLYPSNYMHVAAHAAFSAAGLLRHTDYAMNAHVQGPTCTRQNSSGIIKLIRLLLRTVFLREPLKHPVRHALHLPLHRLLLHPQDTIPNQPTPHHRP